MFRKPSEKKYNISIKFVPHTHIYKVIKIQFIMTEFGQYLVLTCIVTSCITNIHTPLSTSFCYSLGFSHFLLLSFIQAVRECTDSIFTYTQTVIFGTLNETKLLFFLLVFGKSSYISSRDGFIPFEQVINLNVKKYNVIKVCKIFIN